MGSTFAIIGFTNWPDFAKTTMQLKSVLWYCGYGISIKQCEQHRLTALTPWYVPQLLCDYLMEAMFVHVFFIQIWHCPNRAVTVITRHVPCHDIRRDSCHQGRVFSAMHVLIIVPLL